MFGAIVGSVGGGLVSNLAGNLLGGGDSGGGGLFGNILGGGNGGGMLGGLGDIAGKLLAPLGNLFGGGQEQQQAMPGDVKDFMADVKDLLEDILAHFSGQEGAAETSQASDMAPGPGGPININGGSGDDRITMGQPVAAG